MASLTTTILRVAEEEPFLNLTVYVPAFVGLPVHLPVFAVHLSPGTLDEVVQPFRSDIVIVAEIPT